MSTQGSVTHSKSSGRRARSLARSLVRSPHPAPVKGDSLRCPSIRVLHWLIKRVTRPPPPLSSSLSLSLSSIFVDAFDALQLARWLVYLNHVISAIKFKYIDLSYASSTECCPLEGSKKSSLFLLSILSFARSLLAASIERRLMPVFIELISRD